MLSIIIPAYNEEKHLPLLLDALTKQTYQDFEVIVVDAFSEDRTKEVALAFQDKLPLKFIETERKGPGNARNIGASQAEGNLLFFFDADVWMPGNFLEKTLQKFRFRGLDAATCYLAPLSESQRDRILWKFFFNFWLYLMQWIYPAAVGLCIICKRNIHERIKGFDESVVLAEDFDYVNRASRIGKFRILDHSIFTSPRRTDLEGRVSFIVKNIFAGLHKLTIGEIRNDLFRYTFGKFPEKKMPTHKDISLALCSSARTSYELARVWLSAIRNKLRKAGSQPKGKGSPRLE